MTELRIPAPSLVVLVGISGSGKSTFAAQHFGRYEVISSDFCRGLVADDENDQEATKDAFDVLGYIVGKRLERGRLTVVDATNVQPNARRHLLGIAKEHDVLPVAIVLDVPDGAAIARNADRPDRDFGAGVVKRQSSQLHKSLNHLAKEGFRRVHVLHGVDEIATATVVREPLLNDRRDEHGPFDAIGDVHGCRAELESLLTTLGYHLVRDDSGRPVDAVPPDGRRAIFLGDLVDRGPDSPGVLRLVMGMVTAGHALCLPGNHENKLVRALSGRQVRVSHGLERTLEQLDAEDPAFTREVKDFCEGLVAHLVLDGGRLVVAHAGLKEAYHGRASGRVRSFALYGDTTGETDEFGLPVRYPWAEDYRGRAMVLYGHTPVPEPVWVNNTLCLDTGCVFGGRLTALRYPEREIVSVPAERVWYEPVKPLAAATRERDPDQLDAGHLDIGDVLGKRVVETAHHGRVTIKDEDAAGALEVMSRWALRPQYLPYLPPTMAPVATSRREDLLEHPDEAFAAYADLGVTDLVCQEKHMGSRAVVLVRRTDDGPEALYTRTGRTFFDEPTTTALVGGVRAAVTGAGLWDELSTDWLLLDAELLPWSAKAAGLLKDQYAATGAASRSALPPSVAGLEQALARGIDVADLADRTRQRAAAAAAFTDAYRRYCWPTDGTHGVLLAPFQVLASEGRSWADRDHGWHLDVADRLVAQDAGLFRHHPPARRRHHEAGLPGDRRRLVGGADGRGRRGHGGQAAGEPHPDREGPGPAGPEGARPRVPPAHLRSRLPPRRPPRPAARPQPPAQAVARPARVRPRTGVARAVREPRATVAGARGGVRRARAGVRAGGPEAVRRAQAPIA